MSQFIRIGTAEGAALHIENMQEGTTTAGVSPAPDIAAGDFAVSAGLASPIASCLCELAIQFRAARGGVGLSHRDVAAWLDKQLSPA